MSTSMARHTVPERPDNEAGTKVSLVTSEWRLGDMGLVVFFLVALWLPLLLSWTSAATGPRLAEKRGLAPAPTMVDGHFRSFFADVEHYYNDRFGLREPLVRANNWIGLRVFKALPVSKLIVGRDGWVFYDSEKVPDGITISDYEGLVPYSPRDLVRIVAFLKEQAAWYRERGIECLFVVAPNKETLYPEYLPPTIRRIGPRTRLDQVSQAVEATDGIPWLDLRDALMRAKSQSREPLYNRGGTHWNSLGAFHAYHAILTALAQHHPELTPYELGDFDVSRGEKSADDHWLGLADNEVFLLSLRMPSRREPRPFGKVVVVHDSFWRSLENLFALHFQVLRSAPSEPTAARAFIEREHPALVIHEVAERYGDAWWRGRSR